MSLPGHVPTHFLEAAVILFETIAYHDVNDSIWNQTFHIDLIYDEISFLGASFISLFCRWLGESAEHDDSY